MQKRHQLRHVAMSRDQPVADIARVRSRVADAVETGEFRQGADQLRQPPLAAVQAVAVIGVDILAEQRDLARAVLDELARLVQNLRRRPRVLGAAGVGDDAERAKFVAPFLDGKKRGRTLRRSGLRQMVEFGLFRKARIDDAAAAAQRLRHHFRQPVIGLRTKDEIDKRGSAADLGALRLGDATGDGDQHSAVAEAGAASLQRPHLAEFRKDLLCRLFADVAGIEDDEVGVL